jgi:hypothetical protein
MWNLLIRTKVHKKLYVRKFTGVRSISDAISIQILKHQGCQKMIMIINIHIAKHNNPISLLKKNYPFEFPSMQIFPITERGIRNITISLKSKNSSGYGGISTKILKLYGNQISKPLGFIFNKSIRMGIFPEQLKYACIRKVMYQIWLTTDQFLCYQCFRKFLKKHCVVD